MGDNLEMFDRAIRHHQTVFNFKILLVVFRTINDLLGQSSILRMDPLENQRDRRHHPAEGICQPARLASGTGIRPPKPF
jgi:hypothetical protein